MREELNKILAKESLEEADIKILVQNKGLLTQEELVRLGFITVATPVSEILEVKPVKEVEFTPEPVVKKTRSKKVV